MSSVSFAVKREMLWVPREEILPSHRERAYTVKSKYPDVDPIYLWKEKGNQVGLPRNCALTADVVWDETEQGSEAPMKFVGVLRPHQSEVVGLFREKMFSDGTDIILRSDTGSGKTIMILKMLSMIGRTALVIVPKVDLMSQWVARITEFLDVKPSEVGFVRQDLCDYADKKIVIGMIHSLQKDKYSEEFKNYFGVVVFDEVHKLGAHLFSQVGGMFPARYRIGATATLRRADGMEEAFYKHLGRKIISPQDSKSLKARIFVVPFKESSGPIPEYLTKQANSASTALRGYLLTRLAKNRKRTQYVAELISDVYLTGRQTLVLSDRIYQLESIRDLLISDHKVPAEDVGLYLGPTPEAERHRVVKECRIILATSTMLSLGTDIPSLRALVFATPLSDVEQAVGRILRANDLDQDPVVIDVLDTTYSATQRWYDKRVRFYRSKGYEQKIL